MMLSTVSVVVEHTRQHIWVGSVRRDYPCARFISPGLQECPFLTG
jgi:hypothetical protein